MKRLSHFDEQGKIKMVDVSNKKSTARRAVASAKITMIMETVEISQSNKYPSGNPLETARMAGIMAP